MCTFQKCSVDDWLDMYGGGEYEYTEFKCVVFAHPDELPYNLCESCFGMGRRDTFRDMKKGIASFFQVAVEKLYLFYNSKELKDEDTPDELEMEAMVWKKEEIDIHIVSDQYET